MTTFNHCKRKQQKKVEDLTLKVQAPDSIVRFGGQSDFTTTRFLGIDIEQNVFGHAIDRLDKIVVEDPDHSPIVPDSLQMLLSSSKA